MGLSVADLSDLWADYHRRRNAWVAHNFPTTDGAGPLPMLETTYGVIEELGELAHSDLKSKQNIRGTAEEHEAKAKDAIGDMTVYLWGITARQPPDFVGPTFWNKAEQFRKGSGPSRILAMAGWLGYISGSVEKPEDKFFYPHLDKSTPGLVGSMMGYCDERGWDYHEIVRLTWEHVEARDWIAWPDSGFPPEAPE